MAIALEYLFYMILVIIADPVNIISEVYLLIIVGVIPWLFPGSSPADWPLRAGTRGPVVCETIEKEEVPMFEEI